jgi:hypothetical protein
LTSKDYMYMYMYMYAGKLEPFTFQNSWRFSVWQCQMLYMVEHRDRLGPENDPKLLRSQRVNLHLKTLNKIKLFIIVQVF